MSHVYVESTVGLSADVIDVRDIIARVLELRDERDEYNEKVGVLTLGSGCLMGIPKSWLCLKVYCRSWPVMVGMRSSRGLVSRAAYSGELLPRVRPRPR